MARRKDDNLVEMFRDLFMHIPAWACIPIAGFAGVGITALIRWLCAASQNPFAKAFISFAPTVGWGVAIIILFAGFIAAVQKWIRRKTFAKQTGIASIRELSWSAFELLVGEAYRRKGYEVEEVGGGGADGGIDLKLSRGGGTTIVQCKQWKAWKVGVKSIREFYGVLMSERAGRGIFVTSGVFTNEAREFAEGKPLELIDGEALVQLVRPSAGGEVPAVQRVSVEEPESFPACPRCKGLMKLRTAKRGANAGAQFWGCAAYPKCKGTRDVA
jgi:restriction system protein